MLFHTYCFAIFFAIALIGYWLLRRTHVPRLLWLLIASYVFYGWLDVRFLVPLLVTTVVDYTAGRGIAHGKHPKLFLALSLIVDLGLLGTFKYLTFFAENLNIELPDIDIILPIGISFYTFQSLSYTIGLYRKTTEVERNFLRYATFVAMFPQILAGPIERAKNLLPQLAATPSLTSQDTADAITLFITGLFKKLVMADMIAIFVTNVYDAPEDYTAITVITATIGYSWQIYFDFSGYSDMARAVAQLLGFKLMLNFNAPYTAVDTRDFWRKWHISLSSWFKDFVYIPLGGGRCCKPRVWFNVMVTMVVSGFWHGAAWNFIIWGALNGLGSILSPRSDTSSWYGRIPKIIRQLVTFLFITVTWVFFRTATTEEALTILKHCCIPNPDAVLLIPWLPVVLTVVIWLWQLVNDSLQKKLDRAWITAPALLAMLILTFFLGGGAHEQFIYFQF